MLLKIKNERIIRDNYLLILKDFKEKYYCKKNYHNSITIIKRI